MLDAKRPVQSTKYSSSNLSYEERLKRIKELKKKAELREKRLQKEQAIEVKKEKLEKIKKQQEEKRLTKIAEREAAKQAKAYQSQQIRLEKEKARQAKNIQSEQIRLEREAVKQAEKNDKERAKRKAKRQARELKEQKRELAYQKANQIIIEKQQKEDLKRKRKLEKAERRKIEREAAKEAKQAEREIKKANKQKIVASKKPSSIIGRKNLKVYRAKKTLLIFALIAATGFFTYKSGFFQTKYAEYKNKKLLEQSLEETQEENEEIQIVVEKDEEPVVDNTEDEVEEVVEEKHEVISTELFDSGYEFNPEITPEYLQSINPAGSECTAWIEIPGTKINYPVVHPSVNCIDEIEGLREEIEKSGEEESYFMNQYFLKRNLTGDHSNSGTIYQDIYNNRLDIPSEYLRDVNIINGHNMKNGSMFKGLMNWKYDKNGTYNAEHPFGIIYTDDGYGYKVTFISSRIIDGSTSENVHYENFNSTEEKQEFISNMISDAKTNGWFTLDNYEVQEDTKLLFLTTCDYTFENAKFQLCGVLQKIKVRDYVYNDYYVEEESSTLNR